VIVVDDVRKRTALHKLHHDPKLLLDEVAIVKVDNVGMGALAHDDDFVDDEILLWLVVEVHALDGDDLLGLLDLGDINRARRAVSTYALSTNAETKANNNSSYPWPIFLKSV